METKFTKGEWVVRPEESGKGYVRIRGAQLGARFKIANVLSPHYEDMPAIINERESTESFANARLIAAAPKMYSTLEEAADLLYQCTDEDSVNFSGAIRELLAKARGDK